MGKVNFPRHKYTSFVFTHHPLLPTPAVWCVRQIPSPILTNLHQLMDPRAKTTSPQLRGIPKAPQLVEFGR